MRDHEIEAATRPGHRHVEHAERVGDQRLLVPLVEAVQAVVEEAVALGLVAAQLVHRSVGVLSPRDERGVLEELPRELGQHDRVVLEALRGVDGEDPHARRARALGARLLQVGHERPQASATRLGPAMGDADHGLEALEVVGLEVREAIAHAREIAPDAVLGDAQARALGDGPPECREVAPVIEVLEEREQGTPEHQGEAQSVPRMIREPQEPENAAHEVGVHERAPALARGRDALLGEPRQEPHAEAPGPGQDGDACVRRLLGELAHEAHGAGEEVLGLGSTVLLRCLPHPHATGHVSVLVRCPVLLPAGLEGRHGAAGRRVGLQEPGLGQPREDAVHELEHHRRRAPVGRERLRLGPEARAQPLQEPGLRLAEAVDGLLGVAHHEQAPLVPRGGDLLQVAIQDRVLERVRVLVLVQQEVLQARIEPVGEVEVELPQRGLGEQPGQVVEPQPALVLQELVVLRRELREQLGEGPVLLGHLPQDDRGHVVTQAREDALPARVGIAERLAVVGALVQPGEEQAAAHQTLPVADRERGEEGVLPLHPVAVVLPGARLDDLAGPHLLEQGVVLLVRERGPRLDLVPGAVLRPA